MSCKVYQTFSRSQNLPSESVDTTQILHPSVTHETCPTPCSSHVHTARQLYSLCCRSSRSGSWCCCDLWSRPVPSTWSLRFRYLYDERWWKSIQRISSPTALQSGPAGRSCSPKWLLYDVRQTLRHLHLLSQKS